MRSGLTQKDMAFLLDLEATSTISRMEKNQRNPSLQILLACCVIFRVSAAELIPGLLQDIEKAVVIRAETLRKELESRDPAPAAPERISFLEKLISGE